MHLTSLTKKVSNNSAILENSATLTDNTIQMSEGAAKESPYFSHEDVEHGHGGDFLVKQYLQNISKKDENNSNITTEQSPGNIAADASNGESKLDESSVSEDDVVDASELVLDIGQSVHESMDEEKSDVGLDTLHTYDFSIHQDEKAQTINANGRRRQSFIQMSMEKLSNLKDNLKDQVDDIHIMEKLSNLKDNLKDQVDDILDSENNKYQEITGESVFQKFPLPEVRDMTDNRNKFWISSCIQLVLSVVFIVSFSCTIYVILSELLGSGLFR